MTQWLWVSLCQREEIAPQLSSHSKFAVCLARLGCKAAPMAFSSQRQTWAA